MLRNFVSYVAPPHITGFLRHSAYWTVAGSGDLRFENPRYKDPQTIDDTINKHFAVYCLHGIADRTTAYKWISEYLIAYLPPCIKSINIIALSNTMTTFQEDAVELVKRIHANKDRHIIFIGHSKGAIDSIYCAEKLANEANIQVHGVMAITPPLLGSNLAMEPLKSLSPPIKQMASDSEDLKELVDLIRKSTRDYYFYAAGRDGFLHPESCIVKEHCAKSHLYPHEGHTSIMSCPAFIRDITEDLHHLCRSVMTKFPLNETEQRRIQNQPIFTEDEQNLLIVCKKIEDQIKDIHQRTHLKSPFAKIYLLARLSFLLSELTDSDGLRPYPEATTLNEFINAFLHDTQTNFSKPSTQVLEEKLNFSFNFFNKTSSHTMSFIEQLLKEHGSLKLPTYQQNSRLET